MTKHKQTTIKHIAEQANVSISTVSNVLNGNTAEMSIETLHRVQQIIDKLNYRPNQIARGLVTRRTATIGLIVAEIETPLFLQALTAIERDARTAGYNLLLVHAASGEEEQEALELLMDKQVEGVIMLPTSEFKEIFDLHTLRAAQMPSVFVNQSMRHPDFDQINWDNKNGILKAVDHLVALGHRRIAHLRGPANRLGTQERLEGYKLGLQKHNLPFREDYLVDGDYTATPDVWQESTRRLLALPDSPSAIITSDDTVAAVVIETIREAGLTVPGNVSVVGIDDQPFLSFLSLTTIKLPVYEAGKLAIEMLLRRISEPQNPIEHILLPCPLIARKTTGKALT
jgi:DNA-binding LacI/PurR family transcriptional regulator